ncbi:hypothetical protein JW960_23450 [candidate division KSB1 bacterium]|nr:hypothetical protein [candidate division KSB1 bacterium]
MWLRKLENFKIVNATLKHTYLIVLIITATFIHSSLFSSETLPTDHWAYEIIDQLRTAGYFHELLILNRPYSREVVAQSLSKISYGITHNEIHPSDSEERLLNLLQQEFRNELSRIQKEVVDWRHLGLWFDYRTVVDTSKIHSIPAIKGIFSLSPLKCVTISVSSKFDKALLDDPDYFGYKWRGLAVFTEQAYVRWKYKSFDVLWGRDYVKWGPGETGQLILSDASRPLDQFGFSIQYGIIRFSYLGARLNPGYLPDSTKDQLHTLTANRYLSGHRFDIAINKRFKIGLSEMMLYGGANEGIELQYHNPFLYYHAELLNGGGANGNVILGLDAEYFPRTNWKIYAEFILDDIQVERTAMTDLEPAEYGLITGLEHANLFGVDGANIHVEYIRITNRTYNSPNSWEKYLHRRQPLGYISGTDLEKWHIYYQQWMKANFRFRFGIEVTRKGEGFIEKDWDTPWLTFSDEGTYSEAFPSGVVETDINPWCALKYFVRRNVILEWRYSYHQYEQYQHRKNININRWNMLFRLWVSLDQFITNYQED